MKLTLKLFSISSRELAANTLRSWYIEHQGYYATPCGSSQEHLGLFIQGGWVREVPTDMLEATGDFYRQVLLDERTWARCLVPSFEWHRSSGTVVKFTPNIDEGCWTVEATGSRHSILEWLGNAGITKDTPHIVNYYETTRPHWKWWETHDDHQEESL